MHDSTRVREIFAAAVDALPEAREALLLSLCGDNAELRRKVTELLCWHDRTDGPLDRIAVFSHDSAAPAEPPDGALQAGTLQAGTRIGQFVVDSLIGEGGMGVFYRCWQQRPSRVVALKLIRPLFATRSILRRFEYEAEVLGRLQHPGIASIIEAGTVAIGSGAQPYVAMEFVDGLAIDRACLANRMSTRDRVALFAKVCDAVEHAHRRGILHRDLKPDNILIDGAGEPKILDFGVARAIGGSAGERRVTLPMTEGQQLIGTLGYMSPEQASGDSSRIDARADVYGLGATLFEVLTGQLPVNIIGKSLGEAIRAIQEGQPRRLADVDPRLRGDLDTVVNKALSVEPERRYAAVSDFAADLRRWLGDEPVAARPPSSLYRMLKFAKRRRATLIGSCVALVAVGVGGAVSYRALLGEAVARSDADAAAFGRSEIASVLMKLVQGIDPALAQGGDTTGLRQVLGQIEVRVRNELGGQPSMQAELLRVVGDGYVKLGAFAEATGSVVAALALHTRLDGDRSVRVADDIAFLARIALWRGEVDEAARLSEQSRGMRAELLGPEHSDVGASLADLADLCALRGENAEAESMLRRAIAMQRASTEPAAPGRLASSLAQLAFILERQQRIADASSALEEAMAIQRETYGPRSAELAGSLAHRADVALTRHDIGSAESDLRAALDIRIEALGNDHSLTADLRQQLAQLAAFRGAGAEAINLSESVVESLRRSLGPNSPAYAIALGRHGQMLAQLRRNDQAEAAYGEALEIFERAGAPGAASARTLRVEMASLWIDKRQYERAIPLVERQLAEDDLSTAIHPSDREMLLGVATQAYATVAWNCVQHNGPGPGAVEARSLARRGVERGRQLLAARAETVGFRRASARLRLASALLADALATWADEQANPSTAIVLVELEEAERLLSAAHVEAIESSGSDPVGNTSAVGNIESWTARLYWLWSKVAPDARVDAELARWKRTEGGAVATTPTWTIGTSSQ